MKGGGERQRYNWRDMEEDEPLLSRSHDNGNSSTGKTRASSDAGAHSNEHSSYQPLTIFRVLRGMTCLSVLLSTALMMLIYLTPLLFVLVRLFSVHYSRTLVAFFFGRWLAMWPYLFENINGTRVVISGDRVPDSERVLLICNHRTEVDWMYIWNLAERKRRIGYVKYVLKSSVRNAPIFGWAFHVVEFLLLDRKWHLDEPIIKEYLSSFQDKRDPLWLILFPEGTDFTEQKVLMSQQFAEIRGLPKLENVLMPRTRGFTACLSHLHSSLDAVYDVTIGYKYRCPRFIDNLFGTDPAEVHLHVRRIPVNDIPTSEVALSSWLYETFHKKDKLLTFFKRHSQFQSSSTEKELNAAYGLLNFLAVILFTLALLRLMFFSYFWMKLYVACSCLYLTAAPYFNWKPVPFFNRC